MKTRLLVLAISTYVVFSLAAQPPAHAKGYIAYIAQTNSSVAHWIAKELGLYKKHGVDIETIFIDGSVRSIQSLIAGDLSYGGAVGTAVINANLAGGDVAIVQSQINTLPYFIIGNANIKSPEGLRGKTAAAHFPGTASDFALRLTLMRLGIAYKEITAVTLGGAPPRLNATISGQTDFTVVSEGEKLQGERNGLRVIVDMVKLKVPFQFNCNVVTRKKIRDNPDEIRRVVWAMAEAVAIFKTQKEVALKVMQKYSGGLDRGVLEGSYAASSELLVEDTYPTLEGLRQTLAVQALTDPRAAKAKPEDFVDLRFVDELKKSGFLDKLYGRR